MPRNAAIVTGDGNLHALMTWGGLVGYRHFWADTWTSQATSGYLELEERDELADAAYHKTHLRSEQFVWSSEKRFHLGIEYLYGYKTVQSGSGGDAHRGQLAVKYTFF